MGIMTNSAALVEFEKQFKFYVPICKWSLNSEILDHQTVEKDNFHLPLESIGLTGINTDTCGYDKGSERL